MSKLSNQNVNTRAVLNEKVQKYKDEIDIDDLSFVARRDGKFLPKPVGDQMGRCFWNVDSVDDYNDGCKIGHELALEYIDYENNSQGCPMLNLIVADMPRPLTGVEHGFLMMVGFEMMGGPGYARRLMRYWRDCRAKDEAAERAAQRAKLATSSKRTAKKTDQVV